MFYRPWRQSKCLLISLHLTLNTHHSPRGFQSADTHTALHVAREELVLESRDGLLERLTLALKAAILVDFCD
jgi:hypothetical protein